MDMEVNVVKKKRAMKKNNFMQGAFIATLGIVLTKVIGILYVIPFYQIIGEQGGALYGYAYNIYAIFLSISSAGIPMAISKLISEYHTLGYENAKKRAFQLGKRISLILGVLCFIILLIFAPNIAELIIGDIQGGNSLEQITFVIRVIASAILIVPILSIYRGYFEGHKFIAPTSFSQVLEQLVRVAIIICGSFLALEVFHLSLTTAVGVAVFGATIGALVSYFYLVEKRMHNKKQFEQSNTDIKEPKISNKAILHKLFWYALPLIMIDIFKTLYNSVDMVTLVKTLVNGIGYDVKDAESIMSVISTWGLKLNMIIASIGTGVIVSLVPNLTASFVSKDKKDVDHKINQTFQVLLYLTTPMTVGLSLLSKPVWMIFYGASEYGASTFCYFVFVALVLCLFTAAITIIQVLKYYKEVFISLFSGFVLKIVLNVPLIYGFHKMGLPAYYGAITASILGYLLSLVICLICLKSKYGVHYENTIKQLVNIVGATIVMAIVILLLQYVLPTVSSSRLMNIPIVIMYTAIGAIVYLLLTMKSKTLQSVFGAEMINKVLARFKKKKK